MLVGELKTALFKYGFNANDPWLQWLNESYHTIEIERKRWSWLEITETIALGVGVVVLNTAQAMKRPVKVRDVTTELSTGGEAQDLTYVPLTTFEREFGNHKQKGLPEYYTKRGRTLELWPVPESARSISITYIKELGDLVTEAEEPASPKAAHYCTVIGAAAIGLSAENEEERANIAQGQFEAKLQKLVEDDEEDQIGEPEYVEEVEY